MQWYGSRYSIAHPYTFAHGMAIASSLVVVHRPASPGAAPPTASAGSGVDGADVILQHSTVCTALGVGTSPSMDAPPRVTNSDNGHSTDWQQRYVRYVRYGLLSSVPDLTRSLLMIAAICPPSSGCVLQRQKGLGRKSRRSAPTLTRLLLSSTAPVRPNTLDLELARDGAILESFEAQFAWKGEASNLPFNGQPRSA